jgi:hypothetical protein
VAYQVAGGRRGVCVVCERFCCRLYKERDVVEHFLGDAALAARRR